ncbi:hypothetical protein SASPL_138171 [Salvia splendens]|uniref:HAT C-terminal dimerisation domain-containing protein n=1 Tax=Salvia splendens TaxID=180675 RepID=A0A8X8WW63_SALSN|nr:hypothetical protein SASPL_138171 [Salvia splendens]
MYHYAGSQVRMQRNYYNPTSQNCENKLVKVHEVIKDLNIFNILEPCYHVPESIIQLKNTSMPLSFRRLGETERPLPDDEVADIWLNNEAVRRALHADNTSIAGKWDLFTDRISFHHDAGSMIKYHKNLTSRGYRALIYSGYHDMCIPFTGTEAWTKSIGYKIIDEYVKGQVSGYVTKLAQPFLFWSARIRIQNDLHWTMYTQGYDYNLTFLTVKTAQGAGHTVPDRAGSGPRQTRPRPGAQDGQGPNFFCSSLIFLKKDNSIKYSRRNDKIRPFESGGETSLEFFSLKTDCSLFVVLECCQRNICLELKKEKKENKMNCLAAEVEVNEDATAPGEQSLIAEVEINEENLHTVEDCYPNVSIAYRILLTIPVTVASAERSFSKLKLLKNYLRSSMSQDRLNGLTTCSIEKGILENVDLNIVLADFASRNARRSFFLAKGPSKHKAGAGTRIQAIRGIRVLFALPGWGEDMTNNATFVWDESSESIHYSILQVLNLD